MTKILLCDDDKESTEVLESLLKKRQFEVIAPRQFQNLTALIDQTRPDALLLDMCLPDVDAVPVIRHARSRGIPVLAFSGMTSWKQEALNAGCDLFLEKPFTVKAVLEFLNSRKNKGREKAS